MPQTPIPSNVLHLEIDLNKDEAIGLGSLFLMFSELVRKELLHPYEKAAINKISEAVFIATQKAWPMGQPEKELLKQLGYGHLIRE